MIGGNNSNNKLLNNKKGRCDKTLKTSVVEAEKRTNRVSIDSEVFELPSSSFVLEPDYADIVRRPQHKSRPPFSIHFAHTVSVPAYQNDRSVQVKYWRRLRSHQARCGDVQG